MHIDNHLLSRYPDLFTPDILSILSQFVSLNAEQKRLMAHRDDRRWQRLHTGMDALKFLPEDQQIPYSELVVGDIRKGHFTCSEIPADLQRQWVQGTGPATRPRVSTEKGLRNVAYALLSGADGWMFDGEDALGQVETMSLDNQRNLMLAIRKDPQFLAVAEQVSEEMNEWSADFFGRPIISDWKDQLDFTTIIYRARGLHLLDRHVRGPENEAFSASIVDLALYVSTNYLELQKQNRSIVVYLPKIQTAEEAAFWNVLLDQLEACLNLSEGTIKCYVLVEQLEATFQLLEIRAVLGKHFVGFNTGRWDYINSVSDALAGEPAFINPNIEAITMTYAYMAAYEKRVLQAVNTPDQEGKYSLWQGGMEPNIPVGSPAGVAASMEKAQSGARREQAAGASGKWVAHWKMVHIIRPVWEKVGDDNQLGKEVASLTYTQADKNQLVELLPAPRTIRGARNLISVALQYGNAFLQGYQAAALKPADFFGNDEVLYLMEDMATGEIRLSVLWEWLHKKATLTEDDAETGIRSGDQFTAELLNKLIAEEYDKLLDASPTDVYPESRKTTLPISWAIVVQYLHQKIKGPWFIDLLNLNLEQTDLEVASARIGAYYDHLEKHHTRLLEPINHSEPLSI